MRRFIVKAFIFMLPIIVAVPYFSNRTEIIPFAGSISFDSKIYELHKHVNHSIENMAIGSSLTLNSLSSEILSDYFHGETYYNVSSWGQTIEDDYELLKELMPIYSPKRVLMVSNCDDFKDWTITESCSDISSYLVGGKFSDLYLMTKYKLKRGFLDFDAEYAAARLDTCSYACLRFDEWGGVPLDVYGDNISKKRWNGRSGFTFDAEIESYSVFESLCKYLREAKVDLIFVYHPARSSFYADNIDDVHSHISLVQSIVNRYGHTFINELDFSKYPDSLFCDCTHLNKDGARVFTENIVNHLDSIGFKK